jgi:LEA14-like dessication related protein
VRPESGRLRVFGVARLALALLTVAGLAACAALVPKLETPSLSLVGVKLVEAGVFEQRLEVRLRVQNPNDVALPVRGLDVDFELGGEPFATGVSAREFSVPAFGEAEFDMLVTANAATVLLKLLRGDSRQRETIDYRISGKLSTSLGLLRSVPFDERGTLPLAALRGSSRDDRI